MHYYLAPNTAEKRTAKITSQYC